MQSSHYSSLRCNMILQKSFKYADLMHKKHLLLLINYSWIYNYENCYHIFVKNETHYHEKVWGIRNTNKIDKDALNS